MPDWLRDWLARILPRWLAVALLIRRLTPLPGQLAPTLAHRYQVPSPDTGGAFRVDFRQQAPSVDPKEPQGGEGSGRGEDHGWNQQLHHELRRYGVRVPGA